MSVLPPSEFRVMVTTVNSRRVVAAQPNATIGRAGKNRMGYKADKDEDDEQPRKRVVSGQNQRELTDILSAMPGDNVLGVMEQLSYGALKHYCRTNKIIHSYCMSEEGKRITMKKYKEYIKTLDGRIKRLMDLIKEMVPQVYYPDQESEISLVGIYEDGRVALDLDEILGHWDNLCIHYQEEGDLEEQEESVWHLLASDAKRTHKKEMSKKLQGHRCKSGRKNFPDKETAIFTLGYKILPVIDGKRVLTKFRLDGFEVPEDSTKSREDYVFDTLTAATEQARLEEDEPLAKRLERFMRIMFGYYDIEALIERTQSRKR